MNTDVSLSVWLFNVISKVIRGMLAILGAEQADVSGTVGRFSSRGSAFLALTGMGYMLALAGYSLWVARGHLREVWARAMGRPSGADDSGEAIPYRTALIGIGVGTLYLGCWLYQAGDVPAADSVSVFLCLCGVPGDGPDCQRDGFCSSLFSAESGGVRGVRNRVLGVQPARAGDARVQLHVDDHADQ